MLGERDGIAAENQWLKLQVKQLAARLYGRKSEKLTHDCYGARPSMGIVARCSMGIG